MIYSKYQYHEETYTKVKNIINNYLKVIEYLDIGNEPSKFSRSLEVQQQPSKKKYIKCLLNDFIHQMEDFGLYTASLAIMSPIIEFEIKKRQATSVSTRNMFRHVIKCCEQIRHVIVNAMKMMIDEDEVNEEKDENHCNDNENVAEKDNDGGRKLMPKIIDDSTCNSLDVILNYSSSKMRSLLNYMKDTFAGKRAEDINCLIFVQRRYSAKCVYYALLQFLEITPELKDIVRPQFMIGSNSIQPSIENILNTKWSKQV